MRPTANRLQRPDTSPTDEHAPWNTPYQPQMCHILRVCAKHGKHSHFMPISHLAAEYFPAGLRHAEILKIIHSLAQCVVRVRVLKTSRLHTASESARTCTGLVTSIGRDFITVLVPSHAVLDDMEALHTTVEFFYDDNNSTDIITVRGVSLLRHDDAHYAQLICHTCPKLSQDFDALCLRESAEMEWMKPMDETLAVLISHPHGFPKTVTFGKLLAMDKQQGSVQNFPIITDSEASSASVTRQSLSTFLPFLATLSTSSVTLSKERIHKHEQEMLDYCSTTILEVEGDKPSNAVTAVCAAVDRFICYLRRRFFAQSRNDTAHNAIRIYHDAPSCPGSSGGAVLLIDWRSWVGLNEIVVSLPVFLHVGTLKGKMQGVAIPAAVGNRCYLYNVKPGAAARTNTLCL